MVGDTHFVRAENVERQTEDRPECFCYDTKRYALMSQTVLPQLVAEIKDAGVDFVVHLGDFEQGHRVRELAEGDFAAGLRLFETAAPTFVARGGHDYPDEAFTRVIVPNNAARAGRDVRDPYFSFERGNSLFIVLDLVPRASLDQLPWLERELERSEEFEHVFVFGHEPVFNVGRPFFTSLDRSAEITRMLARHRVDCYFCGHTHNQSIVARRTEGCHVLQAMSSAIGHTAQTPVPLDEVRTWLVPRSEMAYCWPGYVENSAPGWVLGEVVGSTASIEWRRVGDGPHVAVAWRRGHVPTETHHRPYPVRRRLSIRDLDRIRRAWLCMCVDLSGDRKKAVTLQGTPIAEFPTVLARYHHRTEIPSEQLVLLGLTNELRIVADPDDEFCVSSIHISAQLDNGEVVRSSVSPRIYTTSDKFDQWRLPMLCRAKRADGLPTVTVSF